MTEAERHLVCSNDLLRSAYLIARRGGKKTNWITWLPKLKEELKAQHDLTNKLREQMQEKV